MMKQTSLASLMRFLGVPGIAREGRTPHRDDEPHVAAQAEIHIDAEPQVVWNLLADVQRWPSWNPAVERVSTDGSIAVGVAFQWRSQGFTVTSTPIEVIFPSEISWTGRAPGTRAWHRWRITAEACGGVRVCTEETFSGWLPRLMPRLMRKKLTSTLRAWLHAIKAAAEAGAP